MARTSDRVIAYVDGFNLYHGMHQARSRRGLWLDLDSLVRSLLRPTQDLTHVHYFTAMVTGSGQPHARARQQDYLDALEAHCPNVTVHVGRFQAKTMTCRSCGGTWTSHEEKESDVSLGVRLVEDAALRLYDVALVISADSDMLPAIRAARRLAPAARVLVGFPPRRSSAAVEQDSAVTATFRIGDRVPERYQLPDPVPHPDRLISRPAHWH